MKRWRDNMDAKVKEFLVSYAESKGWKTDEDNLVEIVTDGKVVWEGDHDERRHWTDITRVVEIGGRFFAFAWATGGDIFDKGWEFDHDTIHEVKPVTKTVTVYEPIA
jgi:hypothetical protein